MSDPRFLRLKTDPRFRRPRKKQTKVVVDERFRNIFEGGNKTKWKGKSRDDSGGRVDKYGRLVAENQDQDDLKRFYWLGDHDEDGKDEKDSSRRPDLARGEVLMESSDEEDDSTDGSDPDEIISLGLDASKAVHVPDVDEINMDEDNFADLDAQAAAYATQHGDEGAEGPGTRTRRLAVVNLDWDHVRADHLFKVCSSLVSPTAPIHATSSSLTSEPPRRQKSKGTVIARGKVLTVHVYPSAFGKKRMEIEEKEGPPLHIYKRGQEVVDENDINEQNVYEVGGEEEYNEDALREYQLQRLRYYYAIITCDTVDAASHIYSELEGTELERSANVFDMSFVPDDMTFDEEPRDEASGDPNTNYKAVEFVTDALRHSKVKLTWDDDDDARVQMTRRPLTRKEIDETNFHAYLAPPSSDESESETAAKESTDRKGKKASRDRLRALLLGGNEEAMPEGWGEDDSGDVDMQITFTPGLRVNKDGEDETTLEKYQKKIREKRKKRKEDVEKKMAEKLGHDNAYKKAPHLDDDFFEPGSANGSDNEEVMVYSKMNKPDDQATDDTTAAVGHNEETALTLTPDNASAEIRHFNMKSIIKAEKGKKSLHTKKRANKEDNEIQEDFTIDVQDERFNALHEDHKFAIDPNNPQFNKTKGMAALLEERRKRQRRARDGATTAMVSDIIGDRDKTLKNLVDSVKRRSSSMNADGGKRRKIH